mmetsp:Transcript_199/g.638  ORF Transcript_199/g.638 Transcript_199/m.638 type:complete len:207 (-) Transcript_199:357-977(-)
MDRRAKLGTQSEQLGSPGLGSHSPGLTSFRDDHRRRLSDADRHTRGGDCGSRSNARARSRHNALSNTSPALQSVFPSVRVHRRRARSRTDVHQLAAASRRPDVRELLLFAAPHALGRGVDPIVRLRRIRYDIRRRRRRPLILPHEQAPLRVVDRALEVPPVRVFLAVRRQQHGAGAAATAERHGRAGRGCGSRRGGARTGRAACRV